MRLHVALEGKREPRAVNQEHGGQQSSVSIHLEAPLVKLQHVIPAVRVRDSIQ